jgi:hypothetical protein
MLYALITKETKARQSEHEARAMTIPLERDRLSTRRRSC